MKAIDFKESNRQIAKDQKEYLTLPAFKADDDRGTMITCQSLTFWERIKVLFRGKIWMSEMTFNKPVTPRFLTVNKWDVFDKEYWLKLKEK